MLAQVGSSTHTPVHLMAFATALLLPIWTLAGWEGSADLAEETRDPCRVAPRSMLRAVLVSGAAGFLLYAVFAMAIPGDIGRTINETSANPMVTIIRSHFGGFASDIVQVIAFVAMFSCLLANVTVAARTSYALSRDNMLPASGILSRVNRTTRTPVNSLVFVGLVAIGINFLSGGIATEVTGMVAVVLYLTYGATLVAALIGALNARIPDAPTRYCNLGRWLKPLCVIGIVWAVVVVVCMTFPQGSHTVAYYTLGFEIAALILYALVLRHRLRNGTAGPKLNFDEAIVLEERLDGPPAQA